MGRYVIMPHHVHLFARSMHDAEPLSKWMQSWKSIRKRKLTESLNISAPIWQRDYFDRHLRSPDDCTDKWNYILANPVSRHLVQTSAEWRWQSAIEDLSF